MRTFTVGEIVKAVNGTLISGFDENFPVYGVSTDSRTAKPGDVFFPLIGEVNDAHDFLGQVLNSGCMVLVVSEPEKVPKEKFLGQAGDPCIIVVEDTTKALQDLAAWYLSTMPLKKKIGVTGSVGKTSTRDMLYYVASTKYVASRSIKNYNNAFGLPLSILDFRPDTEIAVIEMGMKKKGSIDLLAGLTKPDIGVITNIGISHIENFPDNGRQGILETKLEITNYFDDKSVLIVNADNDMLATVSDDGKYRLIRVGSGSECDFTVSDVQDYGDKGISFVLRHEGIEYAVNLPVPGAHNAINATLAIAMGTLIDISIEEAIAGLEKAELTDKRLSVKEAHGIKVIDDSYNAAPDSVKSALNTLMATEGRRHVAMLGDMFELGFESENGHKAVGAYAAQKGVDVCLFIGEKSRAMLDGWVEYSNKRNSETGNGESLKKIVDMPLIYRNEAANTQAEHFPNKEMVMAHCMEHLMPGDVVLVKASNGMHLDKIVAKITGR